MLPGGFRIGAWNPSFGTAQRAGARGHAQAWDTWPKKTEVWMSAMAETELGGLGSGFKHLLFFLGVQCGPRKLRRPAS